MAKKLIVCIFLITLSVVCLRMYVYIRASQNIETLHNAGTSSTSTREFPTKDVHNNHGIPNTDKTPETNNIRTSKQQSPTMHTEQFTLAQNEIVHTKDGLITLTLTGFTIERNEPDPNLPYSPDPGIICPSFILSVNGVEETLSLCIATQGDTPNKNTGSVKNTTGTVTLSVLNMSGSTSSSGHPEKIVVQITY